jgi:hypothetical protein
MRSETAVTTSSWSWANSKGVVGGVPSEHVLAEFFEIDAGKVKRAQSFQTVDEALEAAGLER